MKSPGEHVESVFDQAEVYGKTTIELIKLQVIARVSRAAGSMVQQLALMLAVGMFVLIFNVGLALWVGTLLDSAWKGFMLVALFYLVITIILRTWLSRHIRSWVTDAVVREFMEEDEEHNSAAS